VDRPIRTIDSGVLIDDEASVFINSKIFSGWKTISVLKSISTLSGQFRLEISDKFKSNEISWDFRPGARLKIQLGSDKIIDGFIDAVSSQASSKSRSFSFSGRDLTADIIDSSVTSEPFEFNQIKLEKLIETLIKPFGVSVRSLADTGSAIDKVTISQGESVFDAIDKQARAKGLLLSGDKNGNILIQNPGQSLNRTALLEGQNLLSVSADYNNSERHSDYIVKAQSFGDDFDFGQSVSQVSGSAKDEGIRRFRPLILVGEKSMTSEEAKKRAEFEASARVARSLIVNASVVGWKDSNGSLWVPNQLVDLRASSIGLEERLLIESIEYSKDSSGTISKMRLVRKDSYLPEPIKKQEDDPLQFLRGLRDREQ